MLAGLTERTFTRWKADNEAFCLAIKKAEGKLMLHCTTLILAAAQGVKEYEGTWTSAAWLLERRFPELFSRVDRHQIKTEGERRAPPPEEYVQAVAKALGLTGKMELITKPARWSSLPSRGLLPYPSRWRGLRFPPNLPMIGCRFCRIERNGEAKATSNLQSRPTGGRTDGRD